MRRFTLIELIVTVVILGILALIILINIKGFSKEAEETQEIANMKLLSEAVERYVIDNDYFPTITNQPRKEIYEEIDTKLIYPDYLKKDSIKKKCFVNKRFEVSCDLKNKLNTNSFYIYYGERDALVLKELKKYELVILNTDTWTKQDIIELQKEGTLVLAYMPYSEVNINDIHFVSKLKETDFLKDGGGNRINTYSENVFLLDINSDSYKAAFVSEVNRRLLNGLVDGIFIDTVDNIEDSGYFDHIEYNDRLNQYKELLNKIRGLDKLIIQNRGFIAFDKIHSSEYGLLDGILWEGFRYEDYDTMDPYYKTRYDILKKYSDSQGLVLALNQERKNDLAKVSKFASNSNFIYMDLPENVFYHTFIFDKTPSETYEEKEGPSDKALGSVFELGLYNGQPLRWNLVKSTEEGYMLYASDTIKRQNGRTLYIPFDQKKEYFERDYKEGEIYDIFSREKFGSSNWEHSDVRRFLNNDFLQNAFSEQEKSIIINGNRKILLNYLDSDLKTMGVEYFNNPREITGDISSYSNSISKTVKDFVSLPSVEEMQRAYSVLGVNALSSSNHLMLRDSHKNYGIFYIVENRTQLDNVQPSNPYLAMRPILYVSKEGFIGEGTSENPYRINK